MTDSHHSSRISGFFSARRIAPRMHHALKGLVPGLAALWLLVMLGGCEKKFSQVVDPPSIAPFIVSATADPAVINTDSITVGPDLNPDDVLSITLVCTALLDSSASIVGAQMEYRVLPPDGSRVIGSGPLRDDGVLPDSVRGDRLFTGLAHFSILRSVVGLIQVELVAVSEEGMSSNTVRRSVQIVRLNQPPTLSGLLAPDSVSLGIVPKTILLTIDATDPDGLGDIKRVTFNSFLPSNSPSQGNPFQMYDDGTNGDDVANDGTYALLIALPPTAAIGTYRFEFQAIDRSNAVSPVVIHYITVSSQ